MNEVIISHISAFSIIRMLRCAKPFKEASTENVLHEDALERLPRPIDVVVDSENKFRNNKDFKFHIYPKGLDLKFNSKVKLSIPASKIAGQNIVIPDIFIVKF